jgi:ribosomal-protein-alanine N-acetyltransferase
MALRPIRHAIEDAAPSDVAVMAHIHERSFSRHWSAEELSALLADYPVVQGIVVRRSTPKRARVAGFVIVRSASGEAEILTLAIDPLSRRRGLGRQLVEEAARRAYRDRAEALFLEVDEGNRAAVSLYRGLGFETVGQRSRYYDKPDAAPGTALVMRLRLR